MNIYLVFAMARSGHHAFMHWIGKNYPGTVWHGNNTIRGWDQGQLIPWSNKWRQYPGEGTEARIYNFEDFDISDWIRYRLRELECLRGHQVFPIIFVRDPANWVASSLKVGRYANKTMDTPIGKDEMGRERPSRMELYKRQLREAVCPTIRGSMVIRYGKWFSDAEYRCWWADNLGLGNADKGLQDVTSWGSGSSFSKRKLHGKAQSMPVMERYKAYLGNKRFRRIMKDKELRELSRKVFRFNPEEIWPSS